jgi:hypothetical protein
MSDGSWPHGGQLPGIQASGQTQPTITTRTRWAQRQADPGQPAPSGRAAAGTFTAHAAAIAAFAYALVNPYRTLGGHALVSTVGGYVAQFARREGRGMRSRLRLARAGSG